MKGSKDISNRSFHERTQRIPDRCSLLQTCEQNNDKRGLDTLDTHINQIHNLFSLHFEQTMNTSPTTVSMRPTFAVSDWDATIPLMNTLADQLAQQEMLSLLDWTRAGDDLVLRSTFRDVDAMMSSLDQMASTLSQMDAGPAPMNALEFHGSAEDMKKVRAGLPKIKKNKDLDVDFYDSGTGLQMGSVDDRKALPLSRTACSSHPRFTVNDWAKAEPIMQKFISQTTKEKGCAHFGWTRNGDSLQWTGHYVDGDALKRHFELTRPLLDQLRTGPAALEDMQVHGPKTELEQVTEHLDSLPNVRIYFNEERFPRLGNYQFNTAPRLT